MRIGSSLALIALGAILAFAVDFQISGIDLTIMGYILIGVGVIGLIWSLVASNRSHSTETRTMQDPNTGEQVTRSRSRDGI